MYWGTLHILKLYVGFLMLHWNSKEETQKKTTE